MNLNKYIILFFMLCISYISWAQLSKKHYIPPLFYTFWSDETNYSHLPKCAISNINVQELSLATDSATPISVTITDGGGNPLPNTPVTVSNGNPVTLVLGNEDENTPMMVESSLVNDVVSNKGLILESSKPFYASIRVGIDIDKCNRRFISPMISDGEFVVSKGDKALGKSFRIGNGILNILSINEEINGFFNHYIGIMATEDNTMVKLSEYDSNLEFGLYLPDNRNGLIRSISGNVQDVVLNKGESIVFIAHANQRNLKGFTGALLISDKPIAVNTGNMYGTDTDLMVDQIVPIKYIGKRYGIIRGNDKTRDEYEYGIVVATEDNTEISLDGVSKAFINAGEHYIANYPTSNATHQNLYVESSKPVYMYQVLAGNTGRKITNFTTGFNFIPPLSEYNYHYIGMIPRVNRLGRLTTDAYITILTKDSNKNIFINGQLESFSGLSLTASNGWMTIRKLITDENVVIDSEGPIAVGIFGASGNLGYSGYFSGFSLLEAKICMFKPAVDIFNYMRASDPAQTTPGTWLPAFSSGTNIFDPSVDVGRDYQYTYTSSSGRTRVQSVKITVTAGLDTSGMRIKNLRKECVGNNISYIIETPNLNDGDYKVTYEIEKTGTATITKIEGVKIVNHKIDMVIKKEDISTVGSYKLKLTQIENDECMVILAIEEDFEISPDVNQRGIVLTGLDCQTTTANYIVGIEMMNATAGDQYTLNYKVTGTNTKADTSVDITLDAQKQASWTIPYAEISKIGTNIIELVSIQYKNSACSMRMPANVSKSFDTFYTNTTTLTALVDICQGSDLGVTITDNNLLDDIYEIGYEITNSNTVTSSQDVTIASGTGTFMIPASEVSNTGANTLKIISLKRKNSLCTLPLSISNNFEIFPDINQNGIVLTGVDCQVTTTDYTATIKMPNATASDEYTLIYKITGSNTKADTSIDIRLDEQRRASWTIPYTDISKIGLNTIELISIQYKNSICPMRTLSNVSKNFDIFYTNTTTATILRNICQGSGLGVSITDNNLSDDTYEIGYEVTNSNTVISNKEVTIISGTGILVIPASEIPNAGTNTLKILWIKKKNSQCVLLLSVNNNFNIQPLVSIRDINITIDACILINSSTKTINITNQNPVTNADVYTLVYEITGTNTLADTSVEVTMNGNNGQIIIPTNTLTANGQNTLLIKTIKHKSGSCVTNVNQQYPFKTINETSLNAIQNSLPSSCTQTNQIININLDNAIAGHSYKLSYRLSVANTSSNIEIDIVPNALGEASFTIPASYFRNKGTTLIAIGTVTGCEDKVTNPMNIDTDIILDSTPIISNTDISIPDYVCFGTDILVSIGNRKTIDNGVSYTVTYRLSGSNTTSELTHRQVANNQEITFTIPSNSLPLGGITNLEITKIVADTGCSYVPSISKSFTVVKIDLSKNNYNEQNECKGSSIIKINNPNTSITDGQYRLDYMINQQSKTVEVDVIRNIILTTIPRENFKEGQNELELNRLTHIRSGCSASFANRKYNIDKQGLLDIDKISISVPSLFCNGDDDLEVTLNIPSLSTNTTEFEIKYDLSGENIHKEIVQQVIINTKKIVFKIPERYLKNRGNTTITIRNVKAKNINCEGDNMNLSKDFFTSITPSISSQEINPDYYFCREDNPILSDIYIKSSLADNVLWYDTPESTQALEKSFKLIKNQMLYIKKTNDYGCLSDLISSNINFDVCDNIKIPTKVSVNGDNINESFKVKDLGKLYPNYKINIYNRSGIFVYEDYDTVDSFVGYPNQSEQILNAGIRLPRGIYYYVLFYNDTINNKKPSQGYFYLNY